MLTYASKVSCSIRFEHESRMWKNDFQKDLKWIWFRVISFFLLTIEQWLMNAEKKNKKKNRNGCLLKIHLWLIFFFQTLYRSIYSGEAGTVEQLGTPIQGFLDDYAFLIKGLLDLYEATLDSDWISWANELQKKQIELFWDSQNFGFFTAPDTDKSIILRMKEDQDGAEPSGNSVSSLNLLKLGSYTENSEYKGWQKYWKKFFLPPTFLQFCKPPLDSS